MGEEDPIVRFEKYLRGRNLLTDAGVEEMDEDVRNEVREAEERWLEQIGKESIRWICSTMLMPKCPLPCEPRKRSWNGNSARKSDEPGTSGTARLDGRFGEEGIESQPNCMRDMKYAENKHGSGDQSGFEPGNGKG